jgi:acyl carrier protein
VEKIIRDILANPGMLGSLAHDLSLTANLWDAGMDSVRCVNLLMEIEERWDIEFPGQMVTWEAFSSIGSIVAAVSPLRRSTE